MHLTQKAWLDSGYREFAAHGPSGLKIEGLARTIGKNKSSFYHHFADKDVLTTLLLAKHVERIKSIGLLESRAKSLNELIAIILMHREDLLFNRQLRIHRDRPEFLSCFLKSNEITASSVLPIWSQILGLTNQTYLSGLVLKLSLENFYLQITSETLNSEWLGNYFKELQHLIQVFQSAPNSGLPDGGV